MKDSGRGACSSAARPSGYQKARCLAEGLEATSAGEASGSEDQQHRFWL